MCIYKHSRFEVSKSEKTTFVHFENENVFFSSSQLCVLKERKQEDFFYLRTENGRWNGISIYCDVFTRFIRSAILVPFYDKEKFPFSFSLTSSLVNGVKFEIIVYDNWCHSESCFFQRLVADTCAARVLYESLTLNDFFFLLRISHIKSSIDNFLIKFN